jgi:hypothetical protein
MTENKETKAIYAEIDKRLYKWLKIYAIERDINLRQAIEDLISDKITVDNLAKDLEKEEDAE